MTWLPVLTLSGAAILLVATPILLARGWRRGAQGRLPRAAGWLALLLAMALLGLTTGLETGVALALLVLPLPAWALIWWRRTQPDPSRERAAPANRRAKPRATLNPWPMLARTLIAVPVGLLAAVTLATQMSYLAGDVTAGVMIALGVVVVAWASAAMWAFADTRLWRPAVGLLSVALVAGVPLWIA